MNKKGEKVPRISKFLAASALLSIPLCGNASAVGDVELYSFLNQKLNAEFKVALNKDENGSSVSVKLAPISKFKDAGIPWSSAISGLKFTTKLGSDNTLTIFLTSNDIIRDPVLDFMVEITLPNGVSYKQMSFIVDPPATYAAAPFKLNQASKLLYAERTDNTQLFKHVEKVQPTLSESAYGPVRKNDSLSSIVNSVNKNGFSSKQMMMSIFNKNPSAFYKSNINYLKSGVNLEIPGAGDMLSRDDAKKMYDNQMSERYAGGATKSQDASTDDSTKTSDSKKKLRIAAVSGSDQFLKDEISRLELKINSVQKELDAKNKEIETAAKGKINKAFPTEIQPIVRPVVDPVIEPIVKPVVEPTIEPVVKPVIEPIVKPVVEPTVENTHNTNEKFVSEIVPLDKSKKPEVVVAPPPVIIAPVVDDSVSSTTMIGGASLVLMSILGGLFWRSRKKQDDDSDYDYHSKDPSNINVVDEGDISELEQSFESNSAIDYKLNEESSFLQDFSNTDFAEIEAGESKIDAIAEADVYLAYARYDHAESLIRSAISESPENDKLKLKLLEIFHVSAKADAFENYANELRLSGKHNDLTFWPKVVEMGGEICLDSLMFKVTEPEDYKIESVDQEEFPELNFKKPLDLNKKEIDFDDSFFDAKSTGNTESIVNQAANMFGDEFRIDSNNSNALNEATSMLDEAAMMFDTSMTMDDAASALDEIDLLNDDDLDKFELEFSDGGDSDFFADFDTDEDDKDS